MEIPKEKRLEITKKLPYGWQAEAARLLGVGRSNICNWANGRSNSKRVEKIVLWMVRNNAEWERLKKNTINEFLGN